MKTSTIKVVLIATIGMLLPLFSRAQGVAENIHSLQSILENLYDQMLPLCSRMIDLGRAIAGFAALFFIASRVWRHIAAAEPIDFYPLLRPFAIGICIMSFPAVLAIINGVLKPTVTATAAMVGDSNHVIEVMLSGDESEVNTDMTTGGDPDKWYRYTHPDDPTGKPAANIADQYSGWGVRRWIKKAIYEILNVCFEAAALVIDTIRTFKLIVLAILGPLCFGLSVFDGFQHTLRQWLARYVNVYMWLPVANIFGAIISKIQENITHIDTAGGAGNQVMVEANTAYLIFMIIGIIGYFTVPSIAGYIINAGNHALLSKSSAVTSLVTSAVMSKGMASIAGGAAAGQNAPGNSGGSVNAGGGNPQGFLNDKLSGNAKT